MPENSFPDMPVSDAFLSATQTTIWASTILACIALTALTWTVLETRRRLLPRTRSHLLLNSATGFCLALAFGLVGRLYDAVFDPWHFIGVWCFPPPPLYRYLLLGTPIFVTAFHSLLHRYRRPA